MPTAPETSEPARRGRTLSPWQRLWELLSDFRYAIAGYLFILSTSSIVQVLTSRGLVSATEWGASRHQPAGVLTSLFIHGDASHLMGNMLWMGFFLLLFIVASSSSSGPERRRMGAFFLLTIFVAAVVTNVLFTLVSMGVSFGSSGLAYAALGVAFGLATVHLSDELGTWTGRIRGNPTAEGRPDMRRMVCNLIVFIPVFYTIVTQPEEFLLVREGVNYFGHGIAFLMAYFLTVPYGANAPRPRGRVRPEKG